MVKSKKRWAITLTATALLCGLAFQGALAEEETTPGNRYDKPRYYHSEVSAAEANRKMEQVFARDYSGDRRKRPVIVDVRRLREFAAGHPPSAYNIPYPHIVDRNDQDPNYFVDQVYDLVKGDLDRRIMLLCRTGSRSVDAGNLLADAGFTYVQNIWEGFVGQYKYAYSGGNIAYEIVDGEIQMTRLDLNNDGEITEEDIADVYEESKDKNPDKDGWRNFMDLPWTTVVRWWNAYENDVDQYRDFMTPVIP